MPVAPRATGQELRYLGQAPWSKKSKKWQKRRSRRYRFDIEEIVDVEEEVFASKKRAAGPEVLPFFTSSLRPRVLRAYTIARRCNLFSCCMSSASPGDIRPKYLFQGKKRQ